MALIIETLRMFLRPFQPTDALVLFIWVSDPEVMRFMPTATGRDHSLEQTVARVARYMSYQACYGFSRWLIFDVRNRRCKRYHYLARFVTSHDQATENI